MWRVVKIFAIASLLCPLASALATESCAEEGGETSLAHKRAKAVKKEYVEHSNEDSAAPACLPNGANIPDDQVSMMQSVMAVNSGLVALHLGGGDDTLAQGPLKTEDNGSLETEDKWLLETENEGIGDSPVTIPEQTCTQELPFYTRTTIPAFVASDETQCFSVMAEAVAAMETFAASMAHANALLASEDKGTGFPQITQIPLLQPMLESLRTIGTKAAEMAGEDLSTFCASAGAPEFFRIMAKKMTEMQPALETYFGGRNMGASIDAFRAPRAGRSTGASRRAAKKAQLKIGLTKTLKSVYQILEAAAKEAGEVGHKALGGDKADYSITRGRFSGSLGSLIIQEVVSNLPAFCAAALGKIKKAAPPNAKTPLPAGCMPGGASKFDASMTSLTEACEAITTVQRCVDSAKRGIFCTPNE